MEISTVIALIFLIFLIPESDVDSFCSVGDDIKTGGLGRISDISSIDSDEIDSGETVLLILSLILDSDEITRGISTINRYREGEIIPCSLGVSIRCISDR
jgi:hypothetical protein